MLAIWMTRSLSGSGKIPERIHQHWDDLHRFTILTDNNQNNQHLYGRHIRCRNQVSAKEPHPPTVLLESAISLESKPRRLQFGICAFRYTTILRISFERIKIVFEMIEYLETGCTALWRSRICHGPGESSIQLQPTMSASIMYLIMMTRKSNVIQSAIEYQSNVLQYRISKSMLDS